jgi:hypothetical protein
MPGDAMTSRSFLRLLSPYRILAYIEIAGGIIGLHLSAIQLVKIGLANLTIGVATTLAVFALLFALSVAAGIGLLKRNRFGYVASILIQALQIPALISDVLIYRFIMLIRLLVFTRYVRTGDTNLLFGYEANVLDVGFQFFMGNDANGFTLGANLVPVLFIAILYTSWWKHHRRDVPQARPSLSSADESAPVA